MELIRDGVHRPCADDAAGASSACDGWHVGKTTVMVRNLPRRVLIDEFTAEMTQSGFAGLFDFAYVPSARPLGRKYAFVNFRSPMVAARFAQTWHKTQRFGLQGKSVLSVAVAEIQGFHANFFHRCFELQCANSHENTNAKPPSCGAPSAVAATTSTNSTSARAASPMSVRLPASVEQPGYTYPTPGMLQHEVAVIPLKECRIAQSSAPPGEYRAAKIQTSDAWHAAA